MNFKTTAILFGALILALAIFLIAQLVGKKETDAGTAVFPSLAKKGADVQAGDIDTVEIELNRPKTEKMVFTRAGDGWRLKEPNVRAEARILNELVGQVMKATADDKAEVNQNPRENGLEPPAAVVTLVKKGGEQKWALNVGNVGIGGFDAPVYVTSSERPKNILAVPRRQIDGLFKDRGMGAADAKEPYKTLNDYRSRDLLTRLSHDIQYVSLKTAKLGPIVLERSGPLNTWSFKEPPYGEADYRGDPMAMGRVGVSESGVEGLLSALTNLQVESSQDFVADDVRDLAKYGLDDANPERLRIEIKVKAGGLDDAKEPTPQVLLIGNKVEDGKKPPEKKDDKKDPKKEADKPDEVTQYYALLEEGDKAPKSVVKISGKLRDRIFKVLENPNPLRGKTLVGWDSANSDSVDWIEVKTDRESFYLKKTGAGSWDLIDASGKPRKANGNEVLGLLDLVADRDRRTIRDFPDDKKTDAELGLKQPAVVVSYWTKREEKEVEKKEPDKKDEAKKDEAKKDDKKDEKKDDAKKDDKKDEAKKDDKKEEKKEPLKPEGLPALRLVFGNRVPEKKEEDKKGADKELRFDDRRDDKLVYVLRELGSDRLRAMVPEDMLKRATQEKLAYLDRRLPDFPSDKVTKVVIVRDKETYEIEKEEKDGKTTWRFKRPDPLAGRLAEGGKIADILNRLAKLVAGKLVSEAPTQSDLDNYGLRSPAISATVFWPGDDKKTLERTYSFGKQVVEMADQVHVRTSDGDMVYLVPSTVLTSLKSELADTTILTFDPKKVKQLKLVGWQKVGFPITLDLERKGENDWTAKKAPEGFKLSGRAAEEFVRELSTLKAQRFVAFKSGAKSEHELDPAKGAMQIEITLEGEDKPITLTARDPKADATDKTLYGKSNKLPDDVFVLPDIPFKAVLEAPKYFGAN